MPPVTKEMKEKNPQNGRPRKADAEQAETPPKPIALWKHAHDEHHKNALRHVQAYMKTLGRDVGFGQILNQARALNWAFLLYLSETGDFRWKWVVENLRVGIDSMAKHIAEEPEPLRDNEDARLELDSVAAQELANEDAFLDAPVTTRTLVLVVAHAVQEIKGLDNDAGFTYFTNLQRSALAEMTRSG
jgi:hypothetical protein